MQTAFQLLWDVYNSDKVQALRQQGKLKRFFDKGQHGDDLDFSRADFRQLDFRVVQWIKCPYLRGARLQGANLSVAHLQGANLEAASLQGANLSIAHLQGANLRYVQLQGADLVAVHLQGANLRGAKLQGANLQGAKLQGVDLGEVELNFSVWHKAKFNTDKKSLKEDLEAAELPEDKIHIIIKRFDKEGNEGLWQPKSARIFCNEESFAPCRNTAIQRQNALTLIVTIVIRILSGGKQNGRKF